MKTKITFMIFLITFLMSSVTYASDSIRVAMDQGEENQYYFEKKELKNQETYTVVKGDNLYRIALNHNISLESLMSLNNLTSNIIHPGDVLILSEEKQKDSSQVVTEKFTTKQINEIKEYNEEPKVANGEMVVTATAYTAYCEGCSGTTAYGINLRANPEQKVIAVDPNVIPLGTKVWVENYGVAIAGDTGGAIKGNKIDVFIPSHDLAMQWGVKTVKLKVLN